MNPLVLLHGFLGAPRSWNEVVRDLDPDVSVHALALPGHGPSPWLPETPHDTARSLRNGGIVGTAFDDAVDALAARLPDAAHVVGYSMGARVALGIAARHPSRVLSLTLVGAHPGLEDDAERRARRAWDVKLARDLDAGDLAAFVDAWEALPTFASQRALPDDARARRRHERMDHVPAGLAWAQRTLGLGAMPSLWAALAALRAPVHLVTGAMDEKFTELARRILARAPSCVHTTVGGAGHDVVLEAPRAVATILRGITSERTRPSPACYVHGAASSTGQTWRTS